MTTSYRETTTVSLSLEEFEKLQVEIAQENFKLGMVRGQTNLLSLLNNVAVAGLTAEHAVRTYEQQGLQPMEKKWELVLELIAQQVAKHDLPSV